MSERMMHAAIQANLLILMLCAAPLPAKASLDHLEPDVSSLAAPMPDEYERALDSFFALEKNEERVVRALFRPSFGAEATVGIKCVGAVPEAFSVFPVESIYRSGKAAGDWSPEMLQRLEVRRSSTQIDPHTASLVYMAWAGALLNTRYPEDVTMRVDGVRTLFSASLGGRGLVSAQTHSPQPGTEPRALVELASAIGQYARGDTTDVKIVAELAREVIRGHGNADRRSVEYLHHECLPRTIQVD